ncbi:MAG: DUF1631 family protein [Burkholderiales bacterium]|nr:DUF1631 family protein [Burkholderiales bacterium]
MPARPVHGETTREVRDALAEAFSVSVAGELAAVTELLEHQLQATEDRDKWRPLRQAIDAVRDLGHTLRGRLDAHVRERIDAKLTPGKDAFSQTARFSLESLTLVSEDEVQEEIAIGNAARRLREATTDAFFTLNARLAAAVGVERFPEDKSPVHPRVFARAMLDAIGEATEDRAVRLAAFAAFDPAMLHALPKAFKAGNELLVHRGVLPELRRSYGAPQQVPGARASMPGMETAGGAPVDAPRAQPSAPATPRALFDRLLAAAAAPAPTPAPAPAPAPAGLVTLQVRPELVEALRSLEARMAIAAPTESATPSAPSPDVVRRARDDMGDALTPADGVVADLVAAMFGRLFDDPEVSDAAKVQLGRIQLPVFKAVMADRRFFTDPQHPIRGLIDRIAELGAAGNGAPVEGRPTHEWLAQETDALLAGNAFDEGSFAAARDRLAEVAQRHHEAADEADDVVQSVRKEDAKATALQEAALEVAHRIDAAKCPPVTAAFAYRAWRPVLEHDHRTAGAGSPQWNADIETLEDLLWTLTPRATAAEREKLKALMPTVRYRMWQGLIRAQLPTGTIEGLLDELDGIHGVMQRAPLAAAQHELATTVAFSRPARDDFTATLHVNSEEIRDEGLSRGAWYEFTEDDGTVRRARLAWVSPVQGACVFKDIARNRSFAISLADLRAKREAGRARPVDGPGVARSSIEGALEDVARERGAVASG